MDIPKKLSFSLFLMLMLFKTIVSVPVENIDEYINVKPTTELSYESLVKTNKTLIELFPYLSTQPYANFTEQLTSFAKQELAYFMAKLRDVVSRLNSAESKNKLLTQTSYYKLATKLKLSIKTDLIEARRMIIDIEIRIMKSPENAKKLEDLLAALPDEESRERFKALAKSFRNFVYLEFLNVRTLFNGYQRRMYKKVFGL